MSSIRFELSWLAPAGTEKGDDRLLLELLAGIRATGSVAGAAKAARVSYRHAWGTLNRWESLLARKVVVLERGRGAALAALGEQLLKAEAHIHRRLDATLARLTTELVRDLGGSLGATAPALTLVASHDLALLQLRDLALASDLPLDLHIRGSSESLAAYSRGECNMAGFHLTASHPDLDLRQWLDPRRDAVLHFATRRQGLIMKRGNPKHINAIADLARANVRFINRQEGSGTRVLLDRLLADAGVRPRQVRGYSIEEYTHLAVAATVASGMADAAFGIEAAAVRHGLGFVPVATEQYLLACRLTHLKSKPVVALRRLIASAAFRQATSNLAGYVLEGSGKRVRFSTVVSEPST